MPDELIVILVLVVFFIALAYGLFTRKGSGISSHPKNKSRR